jgi:cbb3-type cytochrome oxidase maturation protein
MSDFFYLIPVALGMGAIGLGVFLWSLRSGQYDDLDGAAERILFDEDDVPAPDKQPAVQRPTEPPPRTS